VLGVRPRRAQAADHDAELLEVHGDHFSLTDTASSAWLVAVKALEELMGAPRA
jgi:hypothetical protein